MRGGAIALVLAGMLLLAAPAAAAPNPFVGVTSDETFAAAGYGQPTQMPAIAGAGVGTLRQTFDWAFLEQGQPPGGLNWAFLDSFVAASASHGIAIMPILFNPPSHRSSRPASGGLRGTYPPRDLGDMGTFGAMLARRYGPTGSFWNERPDLPRIPIRAWQIWNEPNLPVYWRPRPNARAYARMLKLAARRIKAVDPGAEIVTAGMPESRMRGVVPLQRYLTQLFRAGARRGLDTVAINAYAPTGRALVSNVLRQRRLLNRLGARRVGLRVTEFGWADRGPERRRSIFTAGARQGRHISDALRGLWRQRRSLRLRGVAYYGWRDQPVYPGGRDFWGLHTGLHYLDGRPKPAFTRFQSAVRALR